MKPRASYNAPLARSLRAATTNEPLEVDIPVGTVTLKGDLTIPFDPKGFVIFAHGSGSSRLSSRNRSVATSFQEGGLATLLFDLLTQQEEEVDRHTGHLRFDIALLAERLVAVTNFVFRHEVLGNLRIGYFGASTGAAAALVAGGKLQHRIAAIVSRGGRPDLAGEALQHVKAATLFIVGSHDTPVIPLNERALESLNCEKSMVLVPGATHLFEERGALEEVAEMALDWFRDHF